MSDYLSKEELEAICKWPTCAISNGIELFNIRPRNEGFLSREVQCIFPSLGRMVGYAFTATISADLPPGRRGAFPRPDYWEATQSVPRT